MIDFMLTVLAVITGMYLNSFIFCLFKANRYEEGLAKTIAKEVKKELYK